MERFYSLAAMSKQERCPDCLEGGTEAMLSPIPGIAKDSDGKRRRDIRYFCQRCGALYAAVAVSTSPPSQNSIRYSAPSPSMTGTPP